MERKTLFHGKWLNLQAVDHRDCNGTVKPWEFASRTGSGRAVAIIARLHDPERIVLVKQWRPPMDAFTLEFPAGLVEQNDTLEATALRELEEETGFSGRVISVGPQVCSSPGMTDETVGWVEVEITGKSAAHPEADERIETIVLPVDGLLNEIQKICADGTRVEGKLYGFACGLELYKN